jgi:uncharacterized membrane protein
MALRSVRERAYQTIAYEAGAFLIATPLYALIAGHDASQSSLLVIAVAAACMIWAPLHHTLWDWLEWRLKRRVASDRSQAMRVVHAVSHELSSIIVTTPIIMMVGGHSFWHALIVDLGLTLLYSFYAYFFHMAYDRLRPVQATVISSTGAESVTAAVPERAREQQQSRDEPRAIEFNRTAERPRARRPARWAPRILPHAGLALIPARRDDSRVNGF